MPERLILITLSIIFTALLIIFPVFGAKLQYTLHLRNSDQLNTQITDLGVENEVLKAKLARSDSLERDFFPHAQSDIPSPVFSRYPLSLKNEILIARGTSDSVVEGQSVLVSVQRSASSSAVGVLVGRVKSVAAHMSLVTTVFDAQWKSSVRIGGSGAQGLLLGGAEPHVTLVAKDAVLHDGDIIYNADPRFPYGLPIGVIRSSSFTADKTSQEATVQFFYDVNSIENVFVVKNYDASLPR